MSLFIGNLPILVQILLAPFIITIIAIISFFATLFLTWLLFLIAVLLSKHFGEE